MYVHSMEAAVDIGMVGIVPAAIVFQPFHEFCLAIAFVKMMNHTRH